MIPMAASSAVTLPCFDLHVAGRDNGGTVFRLPGHGTAATVRVILAAGEPALTAAARLHTNYPHDRVARFDRSVFTAYTFVQPAAHAPHARDVTRDDFHVLLTVDRPGVFDIVVKDDAGHEYHRASLLVPPALRLRDGVLPLASIAVVTVIPKWLGTVGTWHDQFGPLARAGFNMVHFAPLQVRGDSNSPYSIADQTMFAHDNFEPGTLPEQRDRQLREMLLRMKDELGLLAMTDVVWNHTAHTSNWLLHHPEAGYNLKACPHLRAAYALDEAILQYSADIARTPRANVASEGDLAALMVHFQAECVTKLHLWEYIVLDVPSTLAELRRRLRGGVRASVKPHAKLTTLDLAARVVELRAHGVVEDARRRGERLSRSVDLDYALSLVDGVDDPAAVLDEAVVAGVKQLLDALNVEPYKCYDDLVRRIVVNVTNRVRYERLEAHGPRKGPITALSPLVDTYFTRLTVPASAKDNDRDAYVVVNNGWIFNADPMIDFASDKSDAYLARDVVIWGDCVKLRYGQQPSDNPWLWEHMTRYTEMMAERFHAFRIDNCHSTPIHVGQYLLDKARAVRPDLFVMAELFSGSEERDERFVGALGLHTLVREALAAWSPGELSRIFYRASSVPIGSFSLPAPALSLDMLKRETRGTEPLVCRLKASPPGALFMDCTHDNEIPEDLRAVLPLTALCAFLPCAVGSTRGWDDLYPKHLNVVEESRLYQAVKPGAMRQSAADLRAPLEAGSTVPSPASPASVDSSGIYPARTLLMALHGHLAEGGFIETYVHQESNVLSIHRVHPETHEGFIMFAHTVFGQLQSVLPNVAPSVLSGMDADFVCCAQLSVPQPHTFTHRDHDSVLRGVASSLFLTTTASEAAEYFSLERTDYDTRVHLHKFPPGAVLVLRTRLRPGEAADYKHLIELFDLRGVQVQLNFDTLSHVRDLRQLTAALSLTDLNVLLFRCDAEERDSTGNEFGEYIVPGHGSLGYCGLQGVASVLQPIIAANDMGHAVLQHLRQGLWLLDYLVNRLECYHKHGLQSDGLQRVRDWLAARFELVKRLPKPLQLRAFAVVVMAVYRAGCARAVQLMGPFVQHSGEFVQRLALTSVQLYGQLPSSSLSPFRQTPTLAAGLPHFAARHMRCWGRDTFIALRGLFLTTGRFGEARELLLAFAGCIRHGLVPNLLDSGRFARFNCRDAVWWWLYSVQCYVKMSPEGLAFFDAPVLRLFPHDDSPLPASESECQLQPLVAVVQDVMQRHADGISFRERNAGPNLDSHMRHEGFDVKAYIDWVNGTCFVMGGSQYNCGTWMDKMGESDLAHNYGHPATPRDGAAVEMVGLLKATLRWLTELSAEGLYPYDGVALPESVLLDGEHHSFVRYQKWDNLVQCAFEHRYYVPVDKTQDDEYQVLEEFVTRRGIYRDTWGSATPVSDHQFRPNFLVAMVVAPELFHANHARLALHAAGTALVGPLGVKTLDPLDWHYRGVYDNDNNTTDYAVAKGFNYHQGPEWLWLFGFYLQAGRHFLPHEFTTQRVLERLRPHQARLRASMWAGLPELTNESGAECYFSCPTQAWSSATVLDTLHALHAPHAPHAPHALRK